MEAEGKSMDIINNKEIIKKWIDRISKAEKLRNEFKKNWEECYKAVFGEDYLINGKKTYSNESIYQTKKNYKFDKLLSYLKVEIPHLVLYRPEVFLTPTEQASENNPDAYKEVKKYQDKLNEILNDMDGFENEIKAWLIDAHVAYGVLKLTCEPVFTDETVVDPMTNKEIIQEKLDYLDFKVYRVDPIKFIIDDKCKNDPLKARWMGEEIEKSIEELETNSVYNQNVVAKIKEKHKQDKDDVDIMVKIYEVYDLKQKRIYTIAKDYEDEFLRDDDIPITIDTVPYIILKFTEIPGQFYPKSEIFSGINIQEDLTNVRQWLKKLAMKSIPKKGIRGVLANSEEERQRLLDALSDYVICNPNDVFDINTDFKFGTAVSDFAAILAKDFDEVMSQSELDRGLVGSSKFATEAKIAESQQNIRSQDKMFTVQRALISLFEKIIYAIQESGYAMQMNMTIDVDFDIEIDFMSKTDKNKAIERKQLIEIINVLGANPILMSCPTLLDQLFRNYEIRNKKQIIAELTNAISLMQEQNMSQQPSKPPINVSLNLQHELLPEEAVDKIVDTLFNEDIPISKGNNMLQADQRKIRPKLAGSVMEGIEGMDVGSGIEKGIQDATI